MSTNTPLTMTLSEAGKLGAQARAAKLNEALAAQARAEAEVRRLQDQKIALITFARAKGISHDEIMDVLATSFEEVK